MQLTYRGSLYQAALSLETTESTATLQYRGVTMRHSLPAQMPSTERPIILTYRGNRYITQ